MNENEQEQIKTLPWFGIPKLIPYVKPYRRKIILMVSLGILSSVADAVFPLFNRYALDHFVAEKTLQGLGFFCVLFVVLLVLQSIDNYISTYLGGQVEMGIDRDLRNAAFNHMQTLSFSYFNQNNVGYIHARVMSDSGKIGELVAWHMMDFVWNFSYIIGVLVMMLAINTRLSLFILMLLPPAVLLISFFQKKMVVLNRKIREINSTITGDFNEGITGAKQIKTLVVEDRMQTDFEKDTEEYRRTAVHATHYSAMFRSLVTLMSSAALAIVLWEGGIITQQGVIMIGTLSVFMTYALGMMEPVQSIIATISGVIAIQVNIERLTKLLETESDVADRPEVTAVYGDTFHPKKENWEPLLGDVEFRDVSFHYPDGEEMVLEHFSLKVPQGTSVAIVGETGAGKSTLVNLVCRFYEPTEGTVLIDGKDVRDRSQLWLHSSIGYVLQTPHLFSGTVRENLCYGRENATDEEILEALRLVSADKVVDRMETDWTPRSERAAETCPPARSSSFPLRGHCWRIRRFWCWTKPLLPLTQ